MPNITALIVVATVMFCVLGGVTLLAHIYNLNNIKSKTVGDGQHGTARFSTKAEIRRIYNQISFTPEEWRKKAKKNALPNLPQGIIVGCRNKGSETVALVDDADVHCMMVGAAGCGKTAYWLYPNLEYACASGMSWLCTDTKGDLYRNYGGIAKDCYGYNVAVIDLRNPTRSDGNNLLHLVNKYMDLHKRTPGDVAYRAKAEKYAKIISKTLIYGDGDASAYGQNAFFYDAAEGLMTSVILLIAEFAEPKERHIISVFKLIQELMAPSGVKGKNQFPTPMGKAVWQPGVIQSILSNVKYKGDALLGKTYVEDCISKKVRINGGERPQYYVENNHPAIIDADTFAQVQEELARRASKRKVKQIGTTTEQGKYCGKYALTELLVCGECGTPYRRCTWTAGGQKRIVWRCINRLDYGKKYCHHSPTIEEVPLQNAIMNAILKTAKNNPDILQTLKMHIQMGLDAEAGEDESMDIQIRIAQIDKEFNDILNTVTAENPESLLTDPRIEALMNEKRMLENRLTEYIAAEQHRKSTKSRLEQIFTILDGMKNHPLTFDNEIIRKILQCVIVESKDKIKVVFIGGLEVEAEVEQ